MTFLSKVVFCRRRCRGVLAGRQMPPRPLTLPSGCCGPHSLTGLSPPLRPPTRSPELPSSSHPVSVVNGFYQHGLICRAFQRSHFITVLFFPLKEVWGVGSEKTGWWRCPRGRCRPCNGAAWGPLLAQGSSLYRLSWQTPSLSSASRDPSLGNRRPEFVIGRILPTANKLCVAASRCRPTVLVS